MNGLGTKDEGYSTCYVTYHTSHYVDVGKYHNDQNIPQTLSMTVTNPNKSSNNNIDGFTLKDPKFL
jgi:hypothetical protein